MRTLSDLCADCDGRGYTKSSTTVVYDIFRDIRRIGKGASQQKVVVDANPVIVDMLQGSEHEGLQNLESECNHHIVAQADPLLHLEQYDIVVMEGST